jgi:hypothetical protein
MSGYHTILWLRRLQERVDTLGFRLGNSKHGNYRQEFGDTVSVFPNEDSLPIYARDAELFSGTLEQLEHWLNGLDWGRQYDRMLIGKNIEKLRARKEQDYRNRQLLKAIKGETE